MTDLTARRTALVAYAQSCLASEDWHGLRDAASDLEVIEARLEERGPASNLLWPAMRTPPPTFKEAYGEGHLHSWQQIEGNTFAPCLCGEPYPG